MILAIIHLILAIGVISVGLFTGNNVILCVLVGITNLLLFINEVLE